MPKPRKNNARKSASQPARKTARKSNSAKPRRPAKAVSARGTKARSARPSKKAAIVSLLQRPDGAAISDLTKATGWQEHSVRAALTGMRNEGKELVRDKDAAGVMRYRLTAEA